MYFFPSCLDWIAGNSSCVRVNLGMEMYLGFGENRERWEKHLSPLSVGGGSFKAVGRFFPN